MNLFYLDKNLDTNAVYHIDKHIVKMPLEAAQLLCTTLWVDKIFGYVPRMLNKQERDKLTKAKKSESEKSVEDREFTPYLPTHINHPTAIWVRTSLENYEWAFCYALSLGEEYTYRYGKVHKSISAILNLPETENLPSIGYTTFWQAMPEDYKQRDPVEAYRLYYMMDKAPFASWKFRSVPYWWEPELIKENK